MRVKVCQNLRYSLINKRIYVYGINILVIDNMQEIVNAIASRIDDIQSVAGEMIGIERAYHYAEHNAKCH